MFEELGGRISTENKAVTELKKSYGGKSLLSCVHSRLIRDSVFMRRRRRAQALHLACRCRTKMMAYDRVVSQLNASRLQGTSFPIVHALIEASLALNPDVRAIITQWRRLYRTPLVESPSNDTELPRPRQNHC